jgi:hypothetical protein
LSIKGECDFLIGLHKQVVEAFIAPIIAIIEAKEQEKLRYGIAQ